MHYFDILHEGEDYWQRITEFWPRWKRTRHECSQFLKLKGILYRGVRKQDIVAPIFIGHSPNERHPEQGERREEVDAWLVQHGFKALRRNSLFCANTVDQVHKYGTHYLIFPVNGFHYTWYQNSHDLWQENFNRTLGHKDLSIHELMEVAQPTNTDLEACLHSPRLHEVQILGNYFAFDRGRYASLIFEEVFGNGLQKLVKWAHPEARKRLQSILGRAA